MTTRERDHNRDYMLAYTFGFSLAEYEEMLKKQGGRCAICTKLDLTDSYKGSQTKRLSVDHDHETGVIRGLLCNDCNRALGQFQDSPALLRKAADYLEQAREATKGVASQVDRLLDELMGEPQKERE